MAAKNLYCLALLASPSVVFGLRVDDGADQAPPALMELPAELKEAESDWDTERRIEEAAGKSAAQASPPLLVPATDAPPALLQMDEEKKGPDDAGVDTKGWSPEKVKEFEDLGVLPSEVKTCPTECAAYSWAMMCKVPSCHACDQCVNWAPVEQNLEGLVKQELLDGHYWPGGVCNKCTMISNEDACNLEQCKDCREFGIFCVPKIDAQNKACDSQTDQEKKDEEKFGKHKSELERLQAMTEHPDYISGKKAAQLAAQQAAQTAGAGSGAGSGVGSGSGAQQASQQAAQQASGQ